MSSNVWCHLIAFYPIQRWDLKFRSAKRVTFWCKDEINKVYRWLEIFTHLQISNHVFFSVEILLEFSNQRDYKHINEFSWTTLLVVLEVQPLPLSSQYCKHMYIISILTKWCGNCCHDKSRSNFKVLHEWKFMVRAKHGAHYFFCLLYMLHCRTHACQKEHKNKVQQSTWLDEVIRLQNSLSRACKLTFLVPLQSLLYCCHYFYLVSQGLILVVNLVHSLHKKRDSGISNPSMIECLSIPAEVVGLLPHFEGAHFLTGLTSHN